MLLLFGGVFFVFYVYNPSDGKVFLSCPFKLISGYNCPGCGSQRAIHQLLHGHFETAFRLNPFMVLSLPFIIIGLGNKIRNFIFNTSHRFSLFYNNTFIYTYFAIALVYWVVRNLSFYPFVK